MIEVVRNDDPTKNYGQSSAAPLGEHLPAKHSGPRLYCFGSLSLLSYSQQADAFSGKALKKTHHALPATINSR